MLEGEPEWRTWRSRGPACGTASPSSFKWLETRVQDARARAALEVSAYTPCEACGGARLKSEAQAWRLGTRENANEVLEPHARFMPTGAKLAREALEGLPGLGLNDLMLLPVAKTRAFFDTLSLPAPMDDATELLLKEICTRRGYLCEVGLSYLTLDRQSRTLWEAKSSGINLTTALGTSLSISYSCGPSLRSACHPRDMGRVTTSAQAAREGKSLVVVEQPARLLAATASSHMAGPGRARGEIVIRPR